MKIKIDFKEKQKRYVILRMLWEEDILFTSKNIVHEKIETGKKKEKKERKELME